MSDNQKDVQHTSKAVTLATLRLTLEQCEQALDTSQQESAQCYDALLRARAELDNERKRWLR